MTSWWSLFNVFVPWWHHIYFPRSWSFRMKGDWIIFFWSTTRTHTSCYIILGPQGVLTALTTHWAPPTFLSHAGPQWQQYIKAFLQDRLPSQSTYLVATLWQLWHRCRRLGHHLFHLIHHAIPSNTWARLIVSRLRFKIHEYSAENPTHKFCYFWFLCAEKI